MKQWVKDISAPNELTAQFTLADSNPRFFHNYFQFHQDLGIQIVPEHIFKGQDPLTFTFFDQARMAGRDRPVQPGQFRCPAEDLGSARRSGATSRPVFILCPLPSRLLFLPGYASGTQLNKLIDIEADTTFVRTTGDVEVAIKQHPKINSWIGNQPPYGNVDYSNLCIQPAGPTRANLDAANWTTLLGFNDSKPSYDDPDMRRAVSKAVNRDELLKIANNGGGETALVPLAGLPGLRPDMTRSRT